MFDVSTFYVEPFKVTICESVADFIALRNRIKTTPTPRMARTYTFYSQKSSFKNSMFGNCLNGILATCWVISASIGQIW
jgi:hypothetical protein